jgi:hypothetical protein
VTSRDGRVRVEIGFEGGQIMSALVSAAAAQELEQALGRGEEGAFGLEAEDGRYTVVLRRVDYLKRFAREARVGFGAAAG